MWSKGDYHYFLGPPGGPLQQYSSGGPNIFSQDS